jgi:hypothetical protein
MSALGFVRKYVLSWIVLLGVLVASLGIARPALAGVAACSISNLHQGSISADETWCLGTEPHYILQDVTVQPGVTLTIQAGVTVTGQYNSWGKYLIVKGHLDVNGSAAQPVLMTGPDSSSGQAEWGGIYFDGSGGDGSGNISYATIQYAGSNLGGYNGAIHAVLVKDLPAGKAVNIDHSTIQHNRSKGVYIVNSTVNLTNDTFSQNSYPVTIDGAAAHVSYSGNTFLDNHYGYPNVNYPIDEDGIFIGPDAMTNSDFSLSPQTGLDAYVFYSGLVLPAGRTLTVSPGVLVRVGYREGTCRLDIKGQLNAVGTLAQPIRITGIPNSGGPLTTPNVWRGLVFDGSDGGGTGHLAYVTLDTAAADNLPGGYYALLVENTPDGSQVLVENSTIQDNLDIGVRVIDGHLTMTGSTLQRNSRAMLIAGANSLVPLTGNTFVNNTNNYVYINPGALTAHDINLTLQTGLNAYFFTDTFTVPSGKTLTVQPGVTLRTAANKFLVIQGDLQAVGTANQPIRISDPNDSGSSWGGLVFDGPSGASGHIEHAIIEHGCDWWNGQGCANVILYNIAQNKSVILSHSVIQNSAVTGLRVINSATAQIDNNLISGGQFGVYFGTSMTVRNLAIINPSLDGVGVDTGYTLDARHLTITNSGRTGFYVASGGIATLRNSILSHNNLAVKTDGSGAVQMDTNLSDGNTSFKSGTVTDVRTKTGAAVFEADGYHIQATSSAVGKGIAGLATTDIDGDTRPWLAGSIPDLGADEISASLFNLFIPMTKR